MNRNSGCNRSRKIIQQTNRKRRCRRQLICEPLEQRDLLTTFFVNGDLGNDNNPGSDAEPFATIQRGVNAASANAGDDSVEVKPADGGYAENVVINDASGELAVQGSTGDPADVTVKGGGSNVFRVTLTNAVTIEALTVTGGLNGIYVVGASDFTARDVVADGNTFNNLSNGLHVDSARDVAVEGGSYSSNVNNMLIEDFRNLRIDGPVVNDATQFNGALIRRGATVSITGGSYSGNGDDGLDLRAITGTTIISQVTADNNASEGLSAGGVGNITVRDTDGAGSFSGNRDNGLDIRNADEVRFQNLEVIENGLPNDASGVHVVGADLVDVSAGNLSSNGFHGIGIFNVPSTIVAADLSTIGNAVTGFRVNSSAHVTLTGGSYEQNSFHGIDLNNIRGAVIRGGVVTQNGSNDIDKDDTTGGAGISIETSNTQSILIDSAIIANNTSRRSGAGIELRNPSPSMLVPVTIVDTTISENINQAAQSNFGGGLFAENIDLIVLRSTVSDNHGGAFGGGGVQLTSTQATFTNATISGNSSTGSGGGIGLRTGANRVVTLTNTTVTGNTAVGDGGGVKSLGNVRAINSIFAGNSAGVGTGMDVSGTVVSLGHNLVGDGGGSSGFGAAGDQVGTTAAPIDPLLGPLNDNGGPTETHALRFGSPANGTGNNTGAPGTDQRGVARPQGLIVNIGAFEDLNRAPKADAGGSYEVEEGGMVHLDATGTIDESPETLVYKWDLDGDGVFGETGADAQRGDEVGAKPKFLAAGLDGPSAKSVSLLVADEGGLVDGDTANIQVSNAAPVIESVSSPSLDDKGTADEKIIVSGTFRDAGINDTHTATIDWGDGSEVETIPAITGEYGKGSFAGTHVYTDGGIYTVIITLSDGDGGVDEEATTAVITGVGAVNGTLYVIGSEGRDKVSIRLSTDNDGQVKVLSTLDLDSDSVREQTSFDPDEVDQIEIHLCGGDDQATISTDMDDGLDIPATVFGGDGADTISGGRGNDTLIGGNGEDRLLGRQGDDFLDGGNERDRIQGGSGNDILLGGLGDDSLRGGEGLDLLIGGAGRDNLRGEAAGDILIGALVDLDHDLLADVRDIWTNGTSYSARVAALTDSGGLLEPNERVLDDGVSDKLDGGSGRDLFFAKLLGSGKDKLRDAEEIEEVFTL